MTALTPHLDSDERLRERLRGRLKGALLIRILLISCFLGALALMYFYSGADRYTVPVVLLLWAIAATYAITQVSADLL